MGNSNKKEPVSLTFTPSAIDGEIKVWESIKLSGYSERSSIFNQNIDVDNVLRQLYKAKKDNKVVKIRTDSLYIYYYSEEERRKDEEERRKREEEEKRKKELEKLKKES